MSTEMYAVVVFFPIELEAKWRDRFFSDVATAAHQVEDDFDTENSDRDWDIQVIGTPESDLK